MDVLTSLLTILIIVLAGFLSRRTNLLKAGEAKTLSSFVYYFGLPALFFSKISALDLTTLNPQVVIGTVVPTLAVLLILLALRIVKILKKDTYILLSLSVSFGSYAFFGVAFFETFQSGRWFELAILAASLLGIVGIISTITLFEFANRKEQGFGFISKIFTNPLILSILLGVIASLLNLKLGFLDNALVLIGQTASGTAIFVLGMFIHDRFDFAVVKEALFYSLFRAVVLPLAAVLTIAVLIPGAGDLGQFILLENGMPAAIALVVFAERYEYKVAECAGIVSLTSIISFVILTSLFYLADFLY
jgi:predicted permease